MSQTTQAQMTCKKPDLANNNKYGRQEWMPPQLIFITRKKLDHLTNKPGTIEKHSLSSLHRPISLP